MDLALNNLQRLICHKTKPTNPSIMIHFELISSHIKLYCAFICVAFKLYME